MSTFWRCSLPGMYLRTCSLNTAETFVLWKYVEANLSKDSWTPRKLKSPYSSSFFPRVAFFLDLFFWPCWFHEPASSKRTIVSAPLYLGSVWLWVTESYGCGHRESFKQNSYVWRISHLMKATYPMWKPKLDFPASGWGVGFTKQSHSPEMILCRREHYGELRVAVT